MANITIESANIVFNGIEQHRIRTISDLTFKFLHKLILQNNLSNSGVVLDEVIVPQFEVHFDLMSDQEIARKSALAIYTSIKGELNG